MEKKYPFGQLTVKGLGQMYDRGVQTAKRYADVNFKEIYARSTDYSRTKQSAQSFLNGLTASLNPSYPQQIEVDVYNEHNDFLNPWDTVAELQKVRYQVRSYM